MTHLILQNAPQLPPSLLGTVGLKDARPANVPAAPDSKAVALIAEGKANHAADPSPRLREPRSQHVATPSLGAIGELDAELVRMPVLAAEVGAEVAADADRQRRQIAAQTAANAPSDRFGTPFPKDTAYAIFVVLIEALRLLQEVERDASAKAQIAAHDMTEMSGERLIAAAKDELVGSVVALGATVALQGAAVKTAAKAAKIGTNSTNQNLKASIRTGEEIASVDLRGAGARVGKAADDLPAAEARRMDAVLGSNPDRPDPATLQAKHTMDMLETAKLTQYAQSMAALSMPVSTMINASASVEAAKDRALSQMLQQGADTEKQHAADRTDQASNDKQNMDRMMEMVAEVRRIHAAVADHISSQV